MKDQQRRRIWTSASVLLLLMLVFAIDHLINGDKAAKQQRAIESEAREIPIAAQSTEIGFNSFFKTHNGSVTRTVLTHLGTSELRMFYIDTMPDHGWFLLREEERLSKVRLLFCRNDRLVTLSLPETNGASQTNYSITTGWDAPYEC